MAYKTARKQAKREVAKARNKAYEKLYKKLETKEGENEVFKIAKQRNRQSKDVQQVRVIKSKTRGDSDGRRESETEMEGIF